MAYVYILASQRKGTLYTGVTADLARRLFEHQNKLISGFTEKYDVTTLVYAEHHDHIDDAIRREKCIKKWNRQWKVNLIEQENPDWSDLTSQVLVG